MIKTFEQYNDMDPYNEENWDDSAEVTMDNIYNYLQKLLPIEKIIRDRQTRQILTIIFFYKDYRCIVGSVPNIHLQCERIKNGELSDNVRVHEKEITKIENIIRYVHNLVEFGSMDVVDYW